MAFGYLRIFVLLYFSGFVPECSRAAGTLRARWRVMDSVGDLAASSSDDENDAPRLQRKRSRSGVLKEARRNQVKVMGDESTPSLVELAIAAWSARPMPEVKNKILELCQDAVPAGDKQGLMEQLSQALDLYEAAITMNRSYLVRDEDRDDGDLPVAFPRTPPPQGFRPGAKNKLRM